MSNFTHGYLEFWKWILCLHSETEDDITSGISAFTPSQSPTNRLPPGQPINLNHNEMKKFYFSILSAYEHICSLLEKENYSSHRVDGLEFALSRY